MRDVRHARQLAGVFLLAVLLAACGQFTPLPTTLTARVPQTVELADTPFFPQERYQCGPAALATVLHTQDVKVAPDELVSQVYLPAREGSLQAEMVAAARRQGLMAVAIEPSLEALLEEIAAGRPVLVLQNLGLSWLPRWHYAVAIGYDLARQEMVLRSGIERRRITPFGVFQKTWARSGRWGLVVLEPGGLPVRPDPVRYLEAASALESLEKWEPARAAYQAAAETWPHHPVAWLGLGNAAYALGDVAAAEGAFRQSLNVQPDSAVAWNNLAHVLAARRCIRTAREAARCAARLAPDHPEIRQTVQAVDRLSPPAAQACRAVPDCPGR